MGDMMKKQIERFDSEYNEIFSKSSWTKENIEMMKDLQKLMYYLEVRCAVKEDGDYPGSEYMDRRSYDRAPMHNSMNGHYTYDKYYDHGTMYGRRYYDSEKENAVHELHRLMDSKNDPEIKMAIQEVIHRLEMK